MFWTNFGGLFIIKLTDKNKIEIYRLNKEEYSYKELSKKFKINLSNVKYMVKLADLHGETVLIKKKSTFYTRYFIKVSITKCWFTM